MPITSIWTKVLFHNQIKGYLSLERKSLHIFYPKIRFIAKEKESSSLVSNDFAAPLRVGSDGGIPEDV